MSLIAELKRCNVVRDAGLYLLALTGRTIY